MKLRVKGNSIRIRLSKPEVDSLSSVKYIEEHTSFASSTFNYAVQITDTGNELTADFEAGKITVFIPGIFIRNWATNDVTGFNATMLVNAEQFLYILVEKDFKCLDEVTGDQSENYENPNKTC